MQAWVLDDWKWLTRDRVELLLAHGNRWRYEPCVGAGGAAICGTGSSGVVSARMVQEVPSLHDLRRALVASRKRPGQYPFKRNVAFAWVESTLDGPLLVVAAEGSRVADTALNLLAGQE